MSQTRLGSFLEALANIAIGYVLAVCAQYVIFPMAGMPQQDLGTHLYVGFLFTIVSLVRSYVLRRIFNALMIRRGIR